MEFVVDQEQQYDQAMDIAQAVVEGPTLMQRAPMPMPLVEVLAHLTYRPGWMLHLEDMDRGQGSVGLTLVVDALVEDSRPEGRSGNNMPRQMRVHHYFPVPPAAYNYRSWRRWVLDQLLSVEQHEACEFFRIDGEAVFSPLHAPGNDPYMIVEATYVEQHTNSQGQGPDAAAEMIKVLDGQGNVLAEFPVSLDVSVDGITARIQEEFND